MKKLFYMLAVLLLFTSFHPREATWLALGDSITYLNEHPEEAGNRITQGYMSGVVQQIPGLKYINKGFNGWTAVQVAREIDKLGLVKADYYSVFLGTNDWWAGLPLGSLEDYCKNTGPETTSGAMRVILDKFKALNPEAKIVLITPMQRADFVYLGDFSNQAWGSYKPNRAGQSLEQFADALNAIGQQAGIEVIDLYHHQELGIEKLVKFKRLKDPESKEYKNFQYPEYIGIPFQANKDEYPYPEKAMGMTYDGLHPSDRGYKVITKALLPFFQNNK